MVVSFELIVISRNITHFLLLLRFSTHYFYGFLYFPIDKSVKIFHFRDYDDSHFDCYGHIFFLGCFCFFCLRFWIQINFEDFEIGGNKKIKRLERWLNIQKRNRRSWCGGLRFRVSYILVFSGSLKVEYWPFYFKEMKEVLV